MSNILPKKSWHVYNDKNREKVKKDETSARIEKERTEERAKLAEREHRLSLLRSRANLQIPLKTEIEIERDHDEQKSKRFELFSIQDGLKDEIKGEYEKDLEFKKVSKTFKSSSKEYLKKPDVVEEDHCRNDPMYEKALPKKKSKYGNQNQKDYSFV